MLRTYSYSPFLSKTARSHSLPISWQRSRASCHVRDSAALGEVTTLYSDEDRGGLLTAGIQMKGSSVVVVVVGAAVVVEDIGLEVEDVLKIKGSISAVDSLVLELRRRISLDSV